MNELEGGKAREERGGSQDAPEGGGEEREEREEGRETRECDWWEGGGDDGIMGVEVREAGRCGVERGAGLTGESPTGTLGTFAAASQGVGLRSVVVAL